MADAQQVLEVVAAFVRRTGRTEEVGPGTVLHAGGLGLDSVETAELSAVLDDELGRDPFTEGPMPTTVGDVVAFFTALPR